MTSRQELRAKETKKSILAAASKLFAERGFETVTIREIAKEAGCSHTTIYLYFADKEALLHQLSIPPLEQLRETLNDILMQNKQPELKFKEINREFIRFCLSNRNMHHIFFTVRSSRVDEEPKHELNKLRLVLFGLLRRSLAECLELEQSDDRILTYSRICFFTLYGIVGTYTHSEESSDQLITRLSSTFDEAFEALLIGFRHQLVEREGNG